MYLYELPTTGAISFADFCADHSGSKAYTHHLSEATQARANIRGILKENKRTEDNERDYLSLVKLLEEYLPYIRALLECVAHDEIILKKEPTFSWRITLTESGFRDSPRMDLPGLHAEYSFVLLTYAFALSNLAHSIVTSVGEYEKDRAISDAERKAKDERLNVAGDFLCRASGIFTHISDIVLSEWQTSRAFKRPPDLSKEVTSALARLSLADAQTLAIRRLLSRAAYDSNIAPGPPLPKSHPAPSLLAKLHIECASLYTSARTLAKTHAASKDMFSGKKEVSQDLRHYLGNHAALHHALSHKWLGVDAGEKGGTERGGDAVAFLSSAKMKLDELNLAMRTRSLVIGSTDKRKVEKLDEVVHTEQTSVNAFYEHYKKMNDTLHFQPVPTTKDLQSRIPGGRIAIPAKAFSPPAPAFGPGSAEHARRQAEQLDLDSPVADDETISENRDETHSRPQSEPVTSQPPVKADYAGAGAYF
ncbi:hypothetical protein D9613_000321 [Agrocybe pediades]|uniref:pH-response regulator protein palC n=1 Tax=Agrocybe pediades TaxID=84607 RepID=A0A8H4R2B8_9AGAR|nr:hypothetical protein D9613_000321 [Agrocybe pediades]KAF9564753.1 pH-response regulator protein palC [Agrocybe pediades]